MTIYSGLKTGLCLKEYLYKMLEKNELQFHKSDSVLKKLLIKEFPNSVTVQNKSVNELRGHYNREQFGKPQTTSVCYGEDNVIRTVRKETQRKMSVTAKMLYQKDPKRQKRLQTKKARRKRGEARKKDWQNHEYRKRMIETRKRNWQDPEYRRKISVALRGKIRSKKDRKKMSKAKRAYYKKHPEYTKKILAHKSPNKTELRVQSLLDRLFPNEYKFVGNGEFVLGGKCPDFMNVNGQKKLIEYDGAYHHREYRKRESITTERIENERRKKHFAKYGYKTCIIHEQELFRKDKRLELKLRKFCEI